MAETEPPIVTFTVRDAMVACGVDDEQLFEGSTEAERISEDLFMGNFRTCMDMTNAEMDDAFKTCSA